MKKILLLSILALSVFNLLGQVSVDNITGTANVNIPVYNLSGHLMNFPVSLNYNTGGIKVNEQGEWTGLGWNLNATGSVVRVVHGLPDEMRVDPNGNPIPGGWLQANDLFVPDIGTLEILQEDNEPQTNNLAIDIYNHPAFLSNKADFDEGKLDLEPDEFYISAPGLSCKFVFGINDRKSTVGDNTSHFFYTYNSDGLILDNDPAVTIPYQSLKIEYTRTLDKITSFTITTQSGFVYYFDLQEDVTSRTVNTETWVETETKTTSAWHLTRIVNPNGQIEAEFEYYSTFNMLSEDAEFPVFSEMRVRPPFKEGNVEISVPGEEDGPAQSCRLPFREQHMEAKAFGHDILIKKITTINGVINFVQGPLREDAPFKHSLAEINFEKNSEIINRCKLTYFYFNNGTIDEVSNIVTLTGRKRLGLKNVQFTNAGGQALENPIEFIYSQDLLPDRNSYAQDHWGYYNGQNDNTTLAPQSLFNEPMLDVAACDRSAGSSGGFHLVKILYPEGGFEEFVFENHTYTRIQNEDVIVPDYSEQQVSVTGAILHGVVDEDDFPDQIYNQEHTTNFTIGFSQNVTIRNEGTISESFFVGYPDCNAISKRYLYLTIEDEQNETVFTKFYNSEFEPNTPLYCEEWNEGGDFSHLMEVPLAPGSYSLKIRFSVFCKSTRDISVNTTLTYFQGTGAPQLKTQTAGGLRIKKIITSDGDSDSSNDIVQRFEYELAKNSELSSGVLMDKPEYFVDFYNDIMLHIKHSYNQPLDWNDVSWQYWDNDCFYFYTNSSSKSPQYRPKGSHVLYRNVTVYQDSGGQASGYIRYDYDPSLFPENNQLLVGGYQNMEEWKNTAIRKISYFNSQDELLRTTGYTYEYKSQDFVPGVNKDYLGVDGSIHIESTGVDYEALQEAAIDATISLATTVALCAATGGVNTFSYISMGIDVTQLLYIGYIALFNDALSMHITADNTYKVFNYRPYKYTTEKFALSVIVEKEYQVDNPGMEQMTTTSFHYNQSNAPFDANSYNDIGFDNTKLSAVTVHANDSEEAISSRMVYNSDYTFDNDAMNSNNSMVIALRKMLEVGMQQTVIESIETRSTNSSGPWNAEIVTGGKLTTYKLDANNKIVIDAVYVLDLAEPIPYSVSLLSKIEGGNFIMHESYRRVGQILGYDDYLKPNLVQKEHDIHKTIMRDYPEGRTVARIINALPEECKYTSFETDNQGGWNYNQSSVAQNPLTWTNGLEVTSAVTGTKHLNLSEPVTTTIDPGIYTMSCWVKSGTVAITNTNCLTQSICSELDGANNWVYTEFTITNTGNSAASFSITGSSAITKIDELRLYPSDALMSTIAYLPRGQVHSTCDVNNRIRYCNYDQFNRPQFILDQNFNIRRSLETTKQDPNVAGDRATAIVRIMLEENEHVNEIVGGSLLQDDQIVHKIYYDGLGRPVQMHGVKQSPLNKSIVMQSKFDKYGLSPRTWLPYTTNSLPNAPFVTNFETQQSQFYQTSNHVAESDFPYSDVIFNDTPFKMATEAGSVGSEWQLSGNHTQKIKFEFNEDNEVLRWYPNMEGTGAEAWLGNAPQYWPSGSLFKIIETDENGKLSYTYMDPNGNTVLTRIVALSYDNSDQLPFSMDLTNGTSSNQDMPPAGMANRNVDTYFVYDFKGRLLYEVSYAMLQLLSETSAGFVFEESPNGINGDIFHGLGYAYHYDERNRLVEKKSPQTKWDYLVYNELNQLVMTQDAEQRVTSKWGFVRYDVMGRAVYTGVQTQTGDRSAVQNIWNNVTTNLWETFGNGPVQGYTISGPITQYDKVLSVNYYGHHNFEHTGQNYDGPESLTKRIKGKLTGTKVYVLDQPTDQYLTTTIYYDFKGRTTQIQEQNFLGGYDKFDYVYNWRGAVLTTTRRHSPESGAQMLRIFNSYEYDRLGRLLITRQKTGDDPMVIIAKNQYNELGQLVKRHLHIPDGQNVGMQVLDYRYNIRGWLRSINNSNLVDDGDNLEDFDVFGIELAYTSEDLSNYGANKYASPNALKPIGQYNGMLASIKWNSKNPEDDGTEAPERTYVYRYDDLYRMTAGYYGEEHLLFGGDYGQFTDAKNFRTEKVSYDLAGNIRTLKRYRPSNDLTSAVVMDDLEYTYQPKSYRLKSVHDLSQDQAFAGQSQFVNNANLSDEYMYDELGNLVEDKNKKISYEYNMIGLMKTANHENHPNEPVTYTYDASGNRLKKTTYNSTTYYLNGAEYYLENNQMKLRHILNETGAVRPKQSNENNSSVYVYDYYIQDHLGNLRVVVTEGNATDVVDIATMELPLAYQEENTFESIPDTRSPVPLYYPGNDNNLQVSNVGGSGGTIVGPARLIAATSGSRIQVTAGSWYKSDNVIATTAQTLSQITTLLLSGIVTQGTGVMPPGEAGISLFTNPTSAPSQAVAQFVNTQLATYNPANPQAYLIYLAFDNRMNLLTRQSGKIQVTNPDQLEFLQTQVTMPTNGYFYTFLTNYSIKSVYFDNFTIHHKQGVVRAQYDYYPYGLMWENPALDSRYNETYQAAEWQQGEWSDASTELYALPLRSYDPILGRFHSPDPYEQFHSPYLANFNNPANFVDPSGGWGECFWEAAEAFFKNTKGAVGKNGFATGLAVVQTGMVALNAVMNIGEMHKDLAKSVDELAGEMSMATTGNGVITMRTSDGLVQAPNGNGTHFASDWYSVVDGNLVMTNGFDYQVWNEQRGRYVKGRAPRHHEGSSDTPYDKFPKNLQIGDTYDQYIYDPYGVDYAHGIFGDYRTMLYIGNNEWIILKDFTSNQTADIVTEVVICVFPIGRAFKGGSMLLRWLGVYYAGKKVVSLSKQVTKFAVRAKATPAVEKALLKNADEAAKSSLVFNDGVLESFTKHAFAGGRHADLGLSVEKMASKGFELVEQNMALFKAGDNTLVGNINGIQKSFKVFVQDGKIMSVNMYPGVSGRVTQGTTINFGNVKW